jgi:hypothetical protein
VGRGGGGRLQHPGRSDVDQGRGQGLAAAAAAPAAVATEADEDAGRHAHEHHHQHDHQQRQLQSGVARVWRVALVTTDDLIPTDVAGTGVALALPGVAGAVDVVTTHKDTMGVVRIRQIDHALPAIGINCRRDAGVASVCLCTVVAGIVVEVGASCLAVRSYYESEEEEEEDSSVRDGRTHELHAVVRSRRRVEK